MVITGNFKNVYICVHANKPTVIINQRRFEITVVFVVNNPFVKSDALEPLDRGFLTGGPWNPGGVHEEAASFF